MKKLFAFLLALVFVLSLAACGGNSGKPPDGGNDTPGASQQEQDDDTKDNAAPEGSDAEFTIYVNGSEEWTPFPGKSGVTFSVADEDLISVSDNGAKISFTGKQVGETLITATLDGAECEALVRVREMEMSINYVYAPPEDNYYIAFENTSEDSYEWSEVFARIGRQYMYSYDTSYDYNFIDFAAEISYNRSPTGPWVRDSEGGGLDMEGDWSNPPLPLSAMEEFFLAYVDVDRLSKHFVGTETLYPVPYETTGIECWIFDDKGYSGNNLKYWIDPSNGCCLKYENTENGDCTVVTEYNLNYTAWDNAPQ